MFIGNQSGPPILYFNISLNQVLAQHMHLNQHCYIHHDSQFYAFNFIKVYWFLVVNLLFFFLCPERGKLELLDLTKNDKLFLSEKASEIAKFQRRGNPVVILSCRPEMFIHDDDP